MVGNLGSFREIRASNPGNYMVLCITCTYCDVPMEGCMSVVQGELKERLERHQKGSVPATKLRLPIRLANSSFLRINTKPSNLRNT